MPLAMIVVSSTPLVMKLTTVKECLFLIVPLQGIYFAKTSRMGPFLS
jgi:hypothetical protein